MRQHFSEIDSTSKWLREHVNSYAHGFVVDADFQTAGKGQATNKWESAAGQNLLFSVLLEPTKIAVQHQFLLSQLVSLAIVDTLSHCLACDVRVKWPNDIYVGDGKLCGILIETIVQRDCMEKAIVGIGINVNQTHFVSDAPNPVSMCAVVGKTFDRTALLADVVSRILAYYEAFVPEQAAQVQQRYGEVLYRNAGFHAFRTPAGDAFMAEIVGVEPNGLLMLRTAQGAMRSFAFKEVQFVL